MMNSQSLLDTTGEFSLQMEDFLDSPFGLPSDILPADDGLGGLFGVKEEDPFGDLKSSDSFPQPQSELDDLLLEGVGGPLNDEWMEIVDFNLLNDVPSVESKPQVVSKSEVEFIPPVVEYKSPVVQFRIVKSKPPEQNVKQEPLEQENSAFELLKSLLTGAVSFHQSPQVSIQPTPPESPEPQVAPQIPSPLGNLSSPMGSPESDGCDVPICSPVSVEDEFQQEIPIPSPKFEVIEVEPEVPLQPVIEFDNIEAEDFDLGSPLSSLSTDEIDSILLSSPSSPSDYLQTIDQSQVDILSASFTGENGKSRKHSEQSNPLDSEYKPYMIVRTVDMADLDEASQDSSSNDPSYTPKCSKFVKKSRPAPYTLDTEYLPPGDSLQLTRKEKKRMQNKNAATRYRQKKREQKTVLQKDEDLLQQRNTELRDKVDSLEREIKYMKDLMEEIYKVKAAHSIK